MLDLEAFNGDSGGPVYFYHMGSSRRGESDHGVCTYQFIVGLMKSILSDEYKKEKKLLKRVEVVPSVFIKEAIELLLSREKRSEITQNIQKPEIGLKYEILGNKNDIYPLLKTDTGVNTPHFEGPYPGGKPDTDSGK